MDILIENLFREQDCSHFTVPAFFVKSTAPVNVEDLGAIAEDVDQPTLKDVVELLYQKRQAGPEEAGLVIAIHGYNTGSEEASDGVRDRWYKPLCQYVNEDPFIRKRKGQIFLGYRWPSESLQKKTIRQEAEKALPVLLKGLLYSSLAISIFCLGLVLFFKATLAVVFLIGGVLAGALVLTLYLLRISVYFRDSYRATFFGVPDLVELIRRLDQSLVERKIRDILNEETLYQRLISQVPATRSIHRSVLLSAVHTLRQELQQHPQIRRRADRATVQRYLPQLRAAMPPELQSETLLSELLHHLLSIENLAYEIAQQFWTDHPIKLSFIGHSMGAHVTTQVIRILSDVFDPRSVGWEQEHTLPKMPSSRVGRVFALGRLLLVAPDIPLLTITSGRSNFLRSALRRFEEAYLFSNEGDLALRIASTAANYFSFPAKTRTQGYRLGNLTVSPKHQMKAKSKKYPPVYGILNLEELPNCTSHLLPYLEVSVLNQECNLSLEPAQQIGEEVVASRLVDQEAIADLFTYFDCTEYKDWQPGDNGTKPEASVLVLNGQRSPLRLWDYIRLFTAFVAGKRDVHGGYFQGAFAQLLIYRLAFLGFEGLLDSLLTDASHLQAGRAVPDSLQADLAKVRALQLAKPATPSTRMGEQTYPHWLQEKRRVSLSYFSWLCAQKQIQVAVSPERYLTNVLGRDREVVRESMLLQRVAPPLGDPV